MLDTAHIRILAKQGTALIAAQVISVVVPVVLAVGAPIVLWSFFTAWTPIVLWPFFTVRSVMVVLRVFTGIKALGRGSPDPLIAALRVLTVFAVCFCLFHSFEACVFAVFARFFIFSPFIFIARFKACSHFSIGFLVASIWILALRAPREPGVLESVALGKTPTLMIVIVLVVSLLRTPATPAFIALG